MNAITQFEAPGRRTSVRVRRAEPPQSLVILPPEPAELIYGDEGLACIAGGSQLLLPRAVTPGEAAARPELLRRMEVMFSGWGAPVLDGDFLSAAPALRAVFYGAGSVRNIVTPEFWERGITICSAVVANGIPVAEYAVAALVFGLKRALANARAQREGGPWWGQIRGHGLYRSTVGIVSLGTIGRMVRERLRAFDVEVLAYDPLTDPREAAALGVELVGLGELFARSHAVTVHAPNLPETSRLIRREHLESLRHGACFINTARGAVVHEAEMVAVLAQRPDLEVFLDVTDPEPPAADSPLRSLPNVVLSPHIAGSHGPECRRLGRTMIEEYERWVAGEPLHHALTRERAEVMA